MQIRVCGAFLFLLIGFSSPVMGQPFDPPPAPPLPEEANALPQPYPLPENWMSAFQWREIGPSSMGGRIVDLAVDEAKPSTFYVATASGGLFKTTNNGTTFTPLFQQENTISIGDVCIAPSNPEILWIGTGEHNARNSVSWGDGVYKSVDAGKTWTNMGLKKSFQIGRIVIHPTNPDIVYVGALGRLWGTNEARGIYQTTDGGETWEKIFYSDEKTGCVDLVMHPTDPNTLIAAMYERQRDPFDGGDPVKRWGPGSGLFKSTDAGKTWTKLTKGLPTNKLGRIGICYSRSNPDHIYSIVETELIGNAPPGGKQPAFMGIQGDTGANSARLISVTNNSPAQRAGLKAGDIVTAVDETKVKTYNELVAQIRKHSAGDKVTIKVKRGEETLTMPLTFASRGQGRRPFAGRLGGQVANAQSRQGPNGFQTGGVFKSTDGGESWTRINSLNPRPFYYSQIHVDPSDERYIYVLGVSMYRSSNGGVRFDANAGRGLHPDHHAMWINPNNGSHIVLGCDGGLNISYDRTQSWEFLNNMSIGQFYDVGVDLRTPYRVYGGLQDNGSWGGPSALPRTSIGPMSDDWFVVGGGDGFICRVDPENQDLVYFESQYGNMGRLNLKTGERTRFRAPSTRENPTRFNWKTPYMLSSHNSRIFYCAGTRVYRSLNRGDKLAPISPRVTTHQQGTSTALAESSIDPNVLFVGTDDGNLWATRDGGNKWKKLKIADLPGPRRVNSIELSRFAAGRAYVVYDGHYYNDDQPYVFLTEDYGRTWKSLRSNLPIGSTRVLREDVENENLLYLGTEFGLYVSVDRGVTWNRFNTNLPLVAIHEIAVHPTAGEIVAATHGRSLWILDVSTLQQFDNRAKAAAVWFPQPKTAVLWHGVTGKRLYGQKHYIGKNPPTGAILQYSLKEPAKQISLTITDVKGQTVARLRVSNKAGLHRVSWNLRRPARRQGNQNDPRTRFFNRSGVRVQAGTFLATLKVDGEEYQQAFRVVGDPEYSNETLTLEEEEAIRKLGKVLDD